jgi:MoxR-like ATPase
MDVAAIQDVSGRLRGQVGRVVVGQEGVVTLLLTALLADGHVLLEGVPGTAKTLLARVFAASLSLEFARVQFTPDLMPGDVLGTNLFDFREERFVLRKGPVFTEVLLADEINRTPPKTQAALLQAMQERQVTLDGATHAMGPVFLVVATQNPIEHEGTYPLPEAQLDRFLFHVRVPYPSRDSEREMVRLHGDRTGTSPLEDLGVEPIVAREALVAARATVRATRLAEPLVDYVVDLVRATRERPSLLCGASPRAANMLAAASRALATLEGRDYVVPDDVKRLFLPTLRHRVVLAPGAEIEGVTPEAVLRQVVEQVPAPR